ncbi:hypothetical protein [Streptomyces venezuelae]|uniref:hypothetical protein n=1 Tax=Streptomyces venezuelae TaxID=54571 RepID=UPI0037AD91E8
MREQPGRAGPDAEGRTETEALEGDWALWNPGVELVALPSERHRPGRQAAPSPRTPAH